MFGATGDSSPVDVGAGDQFQLPPETLALKGIENLTHTTVALHGTPFVMCITKHGSTWYIGMAHVPRHRVHTFEKIPFCVHVQRRVLVQRSHRRLWTVQVREFQHVRALSDIE